MMLLVYGEQANEVGLSAVCDKCHVENVQREITENTLSGKASGGGLF